MTANDRPGQRWPLVGRSGELRIIAQALSAEGCRGLMVAGPPGVGKTRLALEALAKAEHLGLPTARASASRAAAELPFGAVAPLLPAGGWPAPAAGTVDRADLLRRFASALSERAGGRRLVLLVDDAHLLDDASATLVYQLAGSGTTVVVATVRTGERAPDPVMALWKDGLVDRLDLDGLDGEKVEELLAEVLGGPVDPATVVRLAARCQGNVLFLRELVLGALEAGSLTDDGGLWRLTGALAPSRRLVDLVESRLGQLADRERALLEAVAVGEPLSWAELAAVAGPAEADALERAGLLVSAMDGRRLQFRLTHPLHGEVLRQGMSGLRRRGVAQALASAVEATGANRAGDTLRVATWRLDAGQGSPALFLDAAAVARYRWDLPLAERFLRAARLDGAGLEAAVEAAHLASLQGRGEEAEAELASLAPQAADDHERGLVALARIDNLRLMGRFADALARADEAEQSMTDRSAREEVGARRIGLLLDTAGPAVAAEAASHLGEPTGDVARAWAGLFGALALTRCGRLEEAVGLVARTQGRAGGPPWTAGVLVLAQADARAHRGELAAAEALAESEHARAVDEGSVESQAHAAWQLAKVLVLQGRVADSARHGREAAALLRQLGRRVLRRDCLVPVALAEALRGEGTSAAEVVAEIDAHDLAPSGWAGVDLLVARAWTVVATGDVAAGRLLLEEAVELGARTGDRVGMVTALHDEARLGFARDVVDRIAAAARAVDGELAPARAAHVAALAADDPGRLELASSAFESMVAWLLAAEAAACAAVAWRRRGDARRAAAAHRRAAALVAPCGVVATPALQGIETRALLTPAERQVAVMAAAGRSNREIATEMFLSLRTVENRLHRIYEKLGIAGRSELGAALSR